MAEKKSSGCKSCLIWMLCIFGFFLLVVGIAAYMGYRKLVSLRDQYTQVKPLAMPQVRYAKQDLDAVRKRIDQFLANTRSEKTNANLDLTASDVNALIASSSFSNRLFVAFTNSSVSGQVSIPLDELGIRFLRGRYLNGAAILAVACTNGDLSVKVRDVSVNGKPLPEHYMEWIRQRNFAENVVTNADVQQALQRIQRVAIEDNHLVFEMKPTNTSK